MDEVKKIFLSLFEGFGISAAMGLIWPEVLHGIAAIVTGFVTTVVIFFTNRYLKKRYDA